MIFGGHCACSPGIAACATMLTTMSTSLHHRAIEHLGARIVAGELPGHPVIGELVEGPGQIIVR